MSSPTYTLINDDDELTKNELTSKSSARRRSPLLSKMIFPLLLFAISLTSFGSGYLYGRGPSQQSASRPNVAATVSVGRTDQIFQHNGSFATIPVAGQPEPAWDSLIPNGLGYVQQAPLAPDFSVISVFHQLHCLYMIRRAYYSNVTAGTQEDFDFGLDRHQHAGHCFEYLRQSLICSADSTIEPAGEKIKGFLGWGFARQCRDFAALKEWAERARVFDAHGFLAQELRLDMHDRDAIA